MCGGWKGREAYEEITKTKFPEKEIHYKFERS